MINLWYNEDTQGGDKSLLYRRLRIMWKFVGEFDYGQGESVKEYINVEEGLRKRVWQDGQEYILPIL